MPSADTYQAMAILDVTTSQNPKPQTATTMKAVTKTTNVTTPTNTDDENYESAHNEHVCNDATPNGNGINKGLCRRDGSKRVTGRFEPKFDDPVRQQMWDSWEGNGDPR